MKLVISYNIMSKMKFQSGLLNFHLTILFFIIFCIIIIMYLVCVVHIFIHKWYWYLISIIYNNNTIQIRHPIKYGCHIRIYNHSSLYYLPVVN